MELDNEWAEEIEQNFLKGQSYVILLRDDAEILEALGAMIFALSRVDGIIIYTTTQRVRHLPSHAEMIFCPADDQGRLRGILRSYKLIDPIGLASPETLHRFR